MEREIGKGEGRRERKGREKRERERKGRRWERGSKERRSRERGKRAREYKLHKHTPCHVLDHSLQSRWPQ